MLEASWKTNTEARALRMKIPAPRGLITDRRGKPLAQSKVVRQMAINFPYLRNATDAEILAFARRQFAVANAAVGQAWNLDDAALLTHYRNRRWLPLVFSPNLTDEQIEKLRPLESEQLFMNATYQRFYPEGAVASHVVGYVGKVGWFPTGPAENGEPLWEETEGRSGIELSMEKELRGKEGMLSALFAVGRQQADLGCRIQAGARQHGGHDHRSRHAAPRGNLAVAEHEARGFRGDGCENRRGAGAGLAAGLRS